MPLFENGVDGVVTGGTRGEGSGVSERGTGLRDGRGSGNGGLEGGSVAVASWCERTRFRDERRSTKL